MSKSDARATLWCESTPWQEMITEASDRGPLETGGLLLGWRNGADIVVSHVVGSGPGAQHGPTTFHQDGVRQAARIAELYEQSDRRLEYLGDWHTHPGVGLGPAGATNALCGTSPPRPKPGVPTRSWSSSAPRG